MATEYDNKCSRKFFTVCKKCEEESEEETIAKLTKIVQTSSNGSSSINSNYRSKNSNEYPLKFIAKYIKPKVLEYIIQNFGSNNINWCIIDNPNLRNNVLHYLISDLSSKTDTKKGIKIINLIFDSTILQQNTVYKHNIYERKRFVMYDVEDKFFNNKNQKFTSWHKLLYQTNDYSYTPSVYAEKRKLPLISRELEIMLFKHVYFVLVSQCHIPKGIAIVIIQFVFEFFHVAVSKDLYAYKTE